MTRARRYVVIGLVAVLLAAFVPPSAGHVASAQHASQQGDGAALAGVTLVSRDDSGLRERRGARRTSGEADTATDDAPATANLSVAHVSQVTQGESTRIPVTLGTASAATISVGGPRYNYQVNATLRDGNGDGRVGVVFSTEAAGRTAPTLRAADDADGVTRAGRETPLDGMIDASDYRVTLVRGPDPDREPVDRGTLVVHDGAGGRDHTDRGDGGQPTPAPPDRVAAQPTTVPLDAAGTLSVGIGLSILALGVLLESRRA